MKKDPEKGRGRRSESVVSLKHFPLLRRTSFAITLFSMALILALFFVMISAAGCDSQPASFPPGGIEGGLDGSEGQGTETGGAAGSRSDQELLERYPDHLDEALEDLGVVG